MEERESQYREKNPKAMMLVFKYLVYDPGRRRGGDRQHHGRADLNSGSFTGDATRDNPKSNKIAPAREVANALMGHRLDDDEIREMNEEGWGEALTDRVALADLEWYADKNGIQKLARAGA